MPACLSLTTYALRPRRRPCAQNLRLGMCYHGHSISGQTRANGKIEPDVGVGPPPSSSSSSSSTTGTTTSSTTALVAGLVGRKSAWQPGSTRGHGPEPGQGCGRRAQRDATGQLAALQAKCRTGRLSKCVQLLDTTRRPDRVPDKSEQVRLVLPSQCRKFPCGLFLTSGVAF